ncbi:MAG: hypothetical protein AAF492_29755, partial [Verrucomicrobiota bacterium]
MNKRNVWKWIILIGLVFGSLAVVTPPSEKVPLGIDLKGGISFTVEIVKSELEEQIKQKQPDLTGAALEEEVDTQAVRAKDNALEVIRNRVDSLGIAEPIIYAATFKDQERIIVQLPGLGAEREAEARGIIQDVAFLEFRLVHKENDEWVKDLETRRVAPNGYKWAENGNTYVRDLDAVKDEQMDKAF